MKTAQGSQNISENLNSRIHCWCQQWVCGGPEVIDFLRNVRKYNQWEIEIFHWAILTVGSKKNEDHGSIMRWT